MDRPYRIEIMPGVWLTAIQSRKFKSSYWSLRLLTPLTQETAAMNAVLPRVLRRGTASCPDQEQLAAALDEMYGGAIEPLVSRRGECHVFGFVASFLDDGLVPDETPLLEQAAQLLGELLLQPATRNGHLKSEYVDGERENLVAEIKSLLNDKRSYANNRLIEEMCADEPFHINRLGSLEQAEKLNVTKLNRYYREVLAAARMEVYYCGSAAPQQVELAWREALMDLPRHELLDLPETIIRMPEGEKQVTDHLDVTQGKLVMGFRTGITVTSVDYPALMVANAIFGGTATSKLFLHVREELSLCYYVNSSLDKWKGLMIVQAGAEFDQLERVKTEVLHQLELMQAGAFTQEELEAAKRSLIATYCSILDVPNQLEDFQFGQNLAGLTFGPDELAEIIRVIDAQQVVEAAQRIQLDTSYFLMGPEGGEEDAQ